MTGVRECADEHHRFTEKRIVCLKTTPCLLMREQRRCVDEFTIKVSPSPAKALVAIVCYAAIMVQFIEDSGRAGMDAQDANVAAQGIHVIERIGETAMEENRFNCGSADSLFGCIELE